MSLKQTTRPKTKAKFKNSRRHTRFKPDPDAYALILFKPRKESKYEADQIALIINESFSGCALVALADPHLEVKKVITVQVGKLVKTKAEIKWRQEIDSGIVKIGLEYITN